MDHHVRDFYTPASDTGPQSYFHEVIPLEKENLDWEKLHRKASTLPRGWFELACLPVADRIAFTEEFWLAKMPFHPEFPSFLDKFFDGIDDISIFLVQPKSQAAFEAHMVYSLRADRGFFRAFPPASADSLLQTQRAFGDLMLPQDFQAFFHIHNGFSKATDTGLIRLEQLYPSYRGFQELLAQKDGMVTCEGKTVDPLSLVPFYESFGMPFFQCFWAEWYPEEEMGNVYYSGVFNTISPKGTKETGVENMAFTTFTEWLMFYLETIES